MKKIFIFIIFIFIFNSFKSEVFAQGTFTCKILTNRDKIPTCALKEEKCDDGYIPIFDNGNSCEEKSIEYCNAIVDFPVPCNLRKCSSPYTCEKTSNCKNISTTLKCYGGDSDIVCCIPSQSCLENGSTTKCYSSEQCCSKYCNSTKTCTDKPPDPDGGGNEPGNPGEALVNVNTLLGSMGGLGFKFTGGNSNLGAIFSSFLPIVYGIAGVGLLLLLIWGGFSYMTSAGDPKKMEAAKGIITTAVIGFIIIIIAFWLTQIANYVLGLGVNL